MSVLYIRNNTGEFIEIQTIKGDPGKDAPQESVLYIEQELDETQQEQARTNIGTVSKAYLVAVFEELKELILAGDMDGVIAVLDQAILDNTVIA